MEWDELLLGYIAPYLGAFVGGCLAGRYYARWHAARMLIGGLLFVLRKLHERGAYLAPYDIAIINVAIDFYSIGIKKEMKK